jgi:hypothetical protein
LVRPFEAARASARSLLFTNITPLFETVRPESNHTVAGGPAP